MLLFNYDNPVVYLYIDYGSEADNIRNREPSYYLFMEYGCLACSWSTAPNTKNSK